MELGALACLAAAATAGALVQAMTGFGFAILAAPVFLAVLNSKAAIPLLVALHIVQSAWLTPSLWPHVSQWHLKRLAIGAVAGCPIGLLLLARLDVKELKLTLGVLILVAVALFVLRGRAAATEAAAPRSQHGPRAVLTGFASGLLTSILVMPGPPLMVYLAGERWRRMDARALSLTFFAGCYVLVLVLALAAGNLTRDDGLAVAALAPFVLAGTLAGNRLGSKISEQHFRQALLVLMLLSGGGAILSAL